MDQSLKTSFCCCCFYTMSEISYISYFNASSAMNAKITFLWRVHPPHIDFLLADSVYYSNTKSQKLVAFTGAPSTKKISFFLRGGDVFAQAKKLIPFQNWVIFSTLALTEWVMEVPTSPSVDILRAIVALTKFLLSQNIQDL